MGFFSKLILFLCLSHLVYAQDSNIRCEQTSEKLISGGCNRECVAITRESFPCPICGTGECGDVVDECKPGDTSTCNDNQICLAAGVAGRYTCINLLGEGDACNVASDDIDDIVERASDLLSNFNDRDALSDLIDAVLPCQSGLVCRRVSLDRRVCMAEAQGPCTTDRLTDAEADCDDDGNFEPLQCQLIPDTRRYRCRCVESSGTEVPDTTTEVDDPSDGPDCEDIVRQRCRYRSRLGLLYEVRSGTPFIDLAACRRCLCEDGEPTLCTQLREDVCRLIDPEPRDDRSCTLRGETIQDGDSVRIGCNRCGCRNGVISCTRRECDDNEDEDDVGEDPEDPEEDRNCRRCASMRAEPVCGNDGRTYPSRCFAMNCRGLESDDIIPGPCSRRNICDTFPCEDNEFCLRAGGVTCLSSSGCSPERLRRCVSLENLRCRDRGEDDDDESGDGSGDDGEETSEDSSDDDDDDDRESVCGNDRRTYPTICNLLQNSAGIQVAYTGQCNRTECSGGEVCGTDGETYDNICQLRTNSANARVDYRGECMDTDDIVTERCRRLRASGRCADLSDCTSRVLPGDGCCPICGGAITIRLDRDSLEQFIRLNPLFDTIDAFIKALVADGFIPENILESCRLAASLLDTGDLHMVLENIQRAGSVCRDFLERIAERINNAGDNPTEVTAIPQLLQSAVVAETAPLVDDVSGAVRLLPLTLALMLLPAIALFL